MSLGCGPIPGEGVSRSPRLLRERVLHAAGIRASRCGNAQPSHHSKLNRLIKRRMISQETQGPSDKGVVKPTLNLQFNFLLSECRDSEFGAVQTSRRGRGFESVVHCRYFPLPSFHAARPILEPTIAELEGTVAETVNFRELDSTGRVRLTSIEGCRGALQATILSVPTSSPSLRTT
jgi:hypothetical protein